MVAALKFPPFVTASSWGTCVAQLWDLVHAKRGRHLTKYPNAEEMTLAPELTNADVVRFVMAWLAALGTRARARALFPLWYQFAAAAYGWNPKTNAWDSSARRASASYPDVLLVEFWKAMMSIASDLDADNVSSPRLDLDGSFMDVTFQGEVKSELRNDGAAAQFKIPTPVCKDKDGRRTIGPKCKRYMKVWPYLCEEYEQCKPVIVDDPITDIKKRSDKALLLVALIVAAWWAYDSKPRRRRRE